MSVIAVIGTGYVGLVTGTCFADLGNTVTCIDIDEQKIEALRHGVLPIYEPGLEELVRRNVGAGRLHFTSSYQEGLHGAEFVFIAVNTPSGPAGEADMTYVRRAAEQIAQTLDHPAIVINKSTVPIGSADLVATIMERSGYRFPAQVVSNPEFLREGQAIKDFMHPDRVVLGATDEETASAVAALYGTLGCPIMVTDVRTAEMIKYASNAFLATRISFINEIASICDELGADVVEVARGMGLDERIGKGFLDAGLGYGGSCFPKDVKALAHMAEIHGRHPQMLRSVMEINRDQRRRVVHLFREALGGLDGRVIAVLGLSFKPNTDDVREAAAIEIIHLLRQEGAVVRAYDPVAMENARRELPEIILAQDPYDAASGADGLLLATEWNEFRALDHRRLLALMRQPLIVDGRNIWDPEALRGLGFTYFGVGRGRRGAARATAQAGAAR